MCDGRLHQGKESHPAITKVCHFAIRVAARRSRPRTSAVCIGAAAKRGIRGNSSENVGTHRRIAGRPVHAAKNWPHPKGDVRYADCFHLRRNDCQYLYLAVPSPRAPARARRRRRGPRLRRADAGPARSDSAAAARARSARAGRDRHGQDRGVRAADAAAHLRSTGRSRARPAAWCWCRPANWRCRSPRRCTSTPRGVGSTVLPLYGGAPMHQQIRALERGAHVVVATPGRALDHIRRGTLELDALRMLVLDEADEMLDMGFADDLDAILKATPETRQTALFSATMPARILSIAERHLKNPARVTIAREKTGRRQGAARPAGRVHRQRARTSRRRSAACSTWRIRWRRWCSAAPGSKSSRWSRRSTRTAIAPRRCTAAWMQRAARPRDGAVPGAEGRSAGRDRRRRARPRHRASLARRQLRRAGVAGGVPAPHRPHRPRRARTARRSRWPSRASIGCCGRSKTSRGRRSKSRRCRPWPTCAPASSI